MHKYLLSLLCLASTLFANEPAKNFTGQPVATIRESYKKDGAWGLCTSIDLHKCGVVLDESAQSEELIRKFVLELCELIDMKRYGQPAIKWFGTGEVQGYTLTQLIETSCISAHWADDRMFLDIFSCKFYDPYVAIDFVKKFFKSDDAAINIWLRK